MIEIDELGRKQIWHRLSVPGYDFRERDGKIRNASGYILTEHREFDECVVDFKIRGLRLSGRPRATIAYTLLGPPPPAQWCESCRMRHRYAPAQVGEKITDLAWVLPPHVCKVYRGERYSGDFERMLRQRPHASAGRGGGIPRVRFTPAPERGTPIHNSIYDHEAMIFDLIEIELEESAVA
jgi:hypothetical protein